MGIEPRIPKQTFLTRKCARCGFTSTTEDFTRTHSIFYPDGYLPICNSCITEYLKQNGFSWEAVDKICQWADIPFIVKEWTRLFEMNGESNAWQVYSTVFADDIYKSLGWKDYFSQYQKLKEAGNIEEELPLIHEQKMKELRETWGANYSDEDLYYLEDLYKGLLTTQNISGGLQIDQARKLCKFSLEIDNRIRSGDKDVDKFISSYDKLVKIAEFTPKNTKNATDFDSFAELALWLEKRGHINKFYDGATRDVIDESLKNIENYNQRLYINEGGIGDAITERLRALKSANNMEQNVYDLKQEFELDEYDNAGFEVEEEEFVVDTEEGDNDQ